MRILLLFLLLPVLVFGQVVEPKLHPGQIGQFGATTGQSLIFNGTVYTPKNAGDIFGSGAGIQLAYFTAAKTIASSSGLNFNTSNIRIGIGTAAPNDKIHTYTSAAGTGVSGLQIDQFNVASSSLRSSKFVTQNLTGGAGRTLFYAASTFLDGSGGEFAIFSENGARILSRFGYGRSGSENDVSFNDFAGSEKVRLSTAGNSFFTGGNVGIGTTNPSYGLHYRSAAKGLRMSIFSDFPSGGETTSPNFMGIDFQGIGGYLFGSICGVDRAQNGNQGGLAFFADPDIITPSQSLRMFIDGATGNVGIGTGVTPSTKLDVVGNFKLTTRTGTATTIAGWGSDNISRDLAIGAGLSISGGTLSSTIASTAFVQGGNSFGAAAVLGTNDANTMRIKANTYGLTLNNTGYITLDDTPSGPPSTPPIGSIFYASNSNSFFAQTDAGAAGTEKILTEKTPNALLLISANATPGGTNYNIRCDANGGAFTVTLGANLKEGKPYLVRCTRNSTNPITFTAASGYTLGIDTDTALTPTTLVSGAGGSGIAAPARIYLIQRIGTIINIK